MTGPIRFVGGNPTDEEVAATVAVLLASAAASAASGSEKKAPPSLWAQPRHVRQGRARSWRESALPK